MPGKINSKLFITGGSGLVGSNLIHFGKKKYEVVSTYLSFPCLQEECQMEKLSLADNKECERLLIKYRPDFVIHSAAYLDLVGCETNKEKTWQINVEATKNIAHICRRIGAKLVYISTDWVFEGKKEGKYTEKDKSSPINSYGKSKWEGEKVLPEDGDWIIARTANVYGWNYAISSENPPENYTLFMNRNSWAVQMLHKLMQGETVKMPKQIYQTPTLASDLAKRIFDMCEMDLRGLFHVCGTSCVNRYEFIVQMGKIFNADPALVKPGTVDDLVTTWGVDAEKFPSFSRTIPQNACLDTTKVREALGKQLLGLKEGLQTMKSELEEVGFLAKTAKKRLFHFD